MVTWTQLPWEDIDTSMGGLAIMATGHMPDRTLKYMTTGVGLVEHVGLLVQLPETMYW